MVNCITILTHPQNTVPMADAANLTPPLGHAD